MYEIRPGIYSPDYIYITDNHTTLWGACLDGSCVSKVNFFEMMAAFGFKKVVFASTIDPTIRYLYVFNNLTFLVRSFYISIDDSYNTFDILKQNRN